MESHVELLCAPCAAAEAGEDISDIDADGKHWDDWGIRVHTDQIGSNVPAIPAEDGAWWGYCSVPPEGVAWWRALPSLPDHKPIVVTHG